MSDDGFIIRHGASNAVGGFKVPGETAPEDEPEVGWKELDPPPVPYAHAGSIWPLLHHIDVPDAKAPRGDA